MKKQVERFGPFKDFIPDGVKVGNTIYLSGAVSVDPTGQIVGVDNFFAQVRQAYANIEEVLKKYGATLENIVDEMWLVTDISIPMGNLEEMAMVRAEIFGKAPDATQTLVQIAALVMPELMIEIKCVAYVD